MRIGHRHNRTRRLLAALLAALLLPLAACGRRAAAPEETAPPVPAETPAPEPTPCAHEWRGGVCALCGAACPHETHDAESAVCLACGEQRWHAYEHGLCTGCGREPTLYDTPLPSAYHEPVETPGAVTEGELMRGRHTCPYVVWTPADYREDGKYNVLILMPGDNGDYRSCVDTEQADGGTGRYRMADVYDHIAAEHLCAPFIVVGLCNFRNWPEEEAAAFLREVLLPFLAENYATWAADGSEESLRRAREHFALGGTSRGSMQAYTLGMMRSLDLFGSFFCCSTIGSAADVAGALEREENRSLPIRCYAASFGRAEPRSMRLHHYRGFQQIVERVDRLTEGENAFFFQISAAHNWNHWGAALYDALPYLF